MGSPAGTEAPHGDCRNQRPDHRSHPAAGAAGCRDASAVDARGSAHVGRRPRPAHRVGSRAVDAGHPACRTPRSTVFRARSRARGAPSPCSVSRPFARSRPPPPSTCSPRRAARFPTTSGSTRSRPRPRPPRSRAGSASSPTTRSAPACCTTSARALVFRRAPRRYDAMMERSPREPRVVARRRSSARSSERRTPKSVPPRSV